MLRNHKLFRALMFTFAFALALPIAMTFTSRPASASGYIYLSGITGDGECTPVHGDDC